MRKMKLDFLSFFVINWYIWTVLIYKVIGINFKFKNLYKHSIFRN